MVAVRKTKIEDDIFSSANLRRYDTTIADTPGSKQGQCLSRRDVRLPGMRQTRHQDKGPIRASKRRGTAQNRNEKQPTNREAIALTGAPIRGRVSLTVVSYYRSITYNLLIRRVNSRMSSANLAKRTLTTNKNLRHAIREPPWRHSASFLF